MYKIEAFVAGDGNVIFKVIDSDGEAKSRGIPVLDEAFSRVSSGIGAIAASLAKGLSEAKEDTKEVEIELAFEIGGGFDIKLVKFTEKSQIKLKIKL